MHICCAILQGEPAIVVFPFPLLGGLHGVSVAANRDLGFLASARYTLVRDRHHFSYCSVMLARIFEWLLPELRIAVIFLHVSERFQNLGSLRMLEPDGIDLAEW
jgi:hypothetical protein